MPSHPPVAVGLAAGAVGPGGPLGRGEPPTPLGRGEPPTPLGLLRHLRKEFLDEGVVQERRWGWPLTPLGLLRHLRKELLDEGAVQGRAAGLAAHAAGLCWVAEAGIMTSLDKGVLACPLTILTQIKVPGENNLFAETAHE